MIASLKNTGSIRAQYTHDFRKGGFLQILDAGAEYFGLSEAQLRDALRAGNSLVEIARTQGKSTEGLKNALLSVFPQTQRYEQLGADLDRMMTEHPRIQGRGQVDVQPIAMPATPRNDISTTSVVNLVG